MPQSLVFWKILSCLVVFWHVSPGPLLAHATEASSSDNVFMIHIGKTGGSSLKSWIRSHLSGKVIMNSHNLRLGDRKNAKYIFLVRDPVDRWISGYLHTLNTCCVESHLRWTLLNAFAMYPSPTAFAEALYQDPEAFKAASSMFHVHRGFHFYLGKIKNHLQDILWVGDLGNLKNHTANLSKMMGVVVTEPPGRLNTVHDLAGKFLHHSNIQFLKNVSWNARCNIERYVSRDYDILDLLWKRGLIQSRYERRCANHNLKSVTIFTNLSSQNVSGNVFGQCTQKNCTRRSCVAIKSAIMSKISMSSTSFRHIFAADDRLINSKASTSAEHFDVRSPHVASVRSPEQVFGFVQIGAVIESRHIQVSHQQGSMNYFASVLSLQFRSNGKIDVGNVLCSFF